MPRLQNNIMDAFGTPDVPDDILPIRSILQTIWLKDQLGDEYDMDSPLGRYSVRSQLFVARCFKHVQRGMARAPKVLTANIKQQRFFRALKNMWIGRGISDGFIAALLSLGNLRTMVLPDFDIRDYYVDEDMEGV